MNRLSVLALVLAAAAVAAVELKLEPDEQAQCNEQGGCVVITRLMLAQLLDHAQKTCKGVRL